VLQGDYWLGAAFKPLSGIGALGLERGEVQGPRSMAHVPGLGLSLACDKGSTSGRATSLASHCLIRLPRSAWRSILTGSLSHRTVRPSALMGDKCFLIRDPYRVDGVVGGDTGEAQLVMLYSAPLLSPGRACGSSIKIDPSFLHSPSVQANITKMIIVFHGAWSPRSFLLSSLNADTMSRSGLALPRLRSGRRVWPPQGESDRQQHEMKSQAGQHQ